MRTAEADSSFVPDGDGSRAPLAAMILLVAGGVLLAVNHVTRRGEEVTRPEMPDITLCGSSNLYQRGITKAACNTAAAICCEINLSTAGTRLTPGQRACYTHFNPPDDAPIPTCMTTCNVAVISCGEVFD